MMPCVDLLIRGFLLHIWHGLASGLELHINASPTNRAKLTLAFIWLSVTPFSQSLRESIEIQTWQCPNWRTVSRLVFAVGGRICRLGYIRDPLGRM